MIRGSFFEHELPESHEFFSVFLCFLCSFFQCRQPSPRFRPGNNIRAIRVIRGSFLSTIASVLSCYPWFFLVHPAFVRFAIRVRFFSPRLTQNAQRLTKKAANHCPRLFSLDARPQKQSSDNSAYCRHHCVDYHAPFVLFSHTIPPFLFISLQYSQSSRRRRSRRPSSDRPWRRQTRCCPRQTASRCSVRCAGQYTDGSAHTPL